MELGVSKLEFVCNIITLNLQVNQFYLGSKLHWLVHFLIYMSKYKRVASKLKNPSLPTLIYMRKY